MTIEIVDLSQLENGGSFHSYVKLPQGNNQKKEEFTRYVYIINHEEWDAHPDFVDG